ncbi:MAG: OmpA family protein [Gammaproteobacteria bacterium]|nr:OmpA family protein [Gammaproteobacteria bacterium]
MATVFSFNTAFAIGGDIYFGLGVGESFLHPDRDDGGLTLADDTDTAYQFLLGYDLTDTWSIEGFVSDLGEAEISPAGTLQYDDTYGGHIVYNSPSSTTGWSVFAGAGYAVVDLNSDTVAFTQDGKSSLSGIFGVRRLWDNGWTGRLEYKYLSEDAQDIIVSVVRRFYTRDSRYYRGRDAAPVETTFDFTAPPADPEPADTRVVMGDSDGDGVKDGFDRCPNTPRGVPVNAEGCAVFEGVLPAVQFAFDSADLTTTAKEKLNEVASALHQFPNVMIAVEAHTDSDGSDQYNQGLSDRRAASVVSYLLGLNITADRMNSQGFGESKPIDTNETKEGRARNRRVEFKARNR